MGGSHPLQTNGFFGGHANAAWNLLPTAFRPEPWIELEGFDPSTANEGIRTASELLLLKEFGESLDRVGLPLPGMLRVHLDSLVAQSDVSPQWPRGYVDLAALAQHHRIPTRLLDFTRHGFVATYFAAHPDSLHGVENPEQVDDLCVWALDSTFLRLGGRCSGIWFALAKASRASNPNLHAQSGLFVVWTVVRTE